MSNTLKPYLQDIEDLYVPDWSQPQIIRIDELDVRLPKQPPLFKMQNYGLAEKDQKFRYIQVPPDLGRWNRRDREWYIAAMWHKRRNGEWWLIKGNPIYINRYAWTFFNFWVPEQGGKAEFRMEGVEFFWFWEECVRDENCFGMEVVKPRRIGDTEKTLFLIWEQCSRTRNAWGGMQNKVDDDAEANFKRLVNAHNSMPFFFKPVTKGKEAPKEALEFDYPSGYNTLAKVKEGKDAIEEENQNRTPALKSRIDFKATVLHKYDGDRLKIYHMDEYGKIRQFNINEQWEIVKQSLSKFNMMEIVGKAILTTTVEELPMGENMTTLSNLTQIWEQSNPNERDARGRTVSGLYRYFRSARLSAKVDEWGYHLADEAEKWIHAERKRLEDLTDYDKLASLKRKYPLSIDDALSPPHNECVLFPALLDKRKSQIKEGLTWTGKEEKKKARMGNLAWVDGVFGGNVMWLDTPDGRWEISQHPSKANAKRMFPNGKTGPANDAQFTFGCDPIDAFVDAEEMLKNKNGNPTKSKGSGVVYRRYNEIVDGHLLKTEDGKIDISQLELMETDQYVCDYVYRHNNPDDFFEDMLMTAIYYGVPMFFETDKPSIGVYFRRHGFELYLKNRPKETRTDPKTFKRKIERGAKATQPLIRQYTEALQVHVLTRIGTYRHQRIIDCHRQYNVTNRTKRDVTVAAGYALLAAMDDLHKRVEERAKDNWENVDFQKFQR